MFSDFIDILGSNFEKNVSEMTDIVVGRIVTAKVELPDIRLPLAHLMAFEDSMNKIRGDVILGPINESTVVVIASNIAEKMGLSAISECNETAEDIFHEFLNTVMGHTVSRCDEIGLTARFEPPSLVRNIRTKTTEASSIATHRIDIIGDLPGSVVVLDQSGIKQQPLSLLVNFSTARAEKPSGKKKILIADDSKMLRTIMKKKLTEAGYDVEEAGDGLEAVVKHRRINPQLTIMDLVMPKMEGLDAIVQIQKESPDARFIICSSISRRDEKVTAGFLNVLHYIVKPMRLEDVVEKVEDAFRQIEKQGNRI
jgi:two-component system chemotaxis response regulator CheY